MIIEHEWPEWIERELIAYLSRINNKPIGQFRIIITATGGHGVDRGKKDGEIVDFNADGEYTPDAIAKRLVNELKRFGATLKNASIVHWPETDGQVTDDLLTGIRKGNF